MLWNFCAAQEYLFAFWGSRIPVFALERVFGSRIHLCALLQLFGIDLLSDASPPSTEHATLLSSLNGKMKKPDASPPRCKTKDVFHPARRSESLPSERAAQHVGTSEHQNIRILCPNRAATVGQGGPWPYGSRVYDGTSEHIRGQRDPGPRARGSCSDRDWHRKQLDSS